MLISTIYQFHPFKQDNHRKFFHINFNLVYKLFIAVCSSRLSLTFNLTKENCMSNTLPHPSYIHPQHSIGFTTTDSHHPEMSDDDQLRFFHEVQSELQQLEEASI